MSTVKLKKDRGNDKAGAVVSVPFGVGQSLVESGLAEYPKQVAPPVVVRPAVMPEAERHAAEITRLNALHATNIAELREAAADAAKKTAKEHEAAMKKLVADLDAANATIAELQSKGNKK